MKYAGKKLQNRTVSKKKINKHKGEKKSNLKATYNNASV